MSLSYPVSRRHHLEVMAGAAVFAALGGAGAFSVPAAAATADPRWISGVDLGMLLEVEEKGGRFSTSASSSRDAVKILADAGANLTRLRLWVDPYTAQGEPYGGGTNDLTRTIRLAKRAVAQGMSILLDFHLSDWWADPGTQTKPKAWRNLSGEALRRQVRSYTKAVITQMKAAGVRPSMVQMGNEISSGILWDDGRVGAGHDDFSGLAGLLKAGFQGVEDALSPGEKIERVLHLDMGGDNALYRWWFDGVIAQGVSFDIIGLSYYPFWHRSMGELKWNLNDLVRRYGKDVLIVETAYGWTLEDGDGITDSFYRKEEAEGGYPATVAGQSAYLRDLRDLIAGVPGGHGRGYIWWEPAWLPVGDAYWGSEAGARDNNDTGVRGNPWDNQTLFDFSGRALDTQKVLSEPVAKNLVRNGSFEDDGYTSSPSGWGVWSPDSRDDNAAFVSDSAVHGGYKLTHWKADDYVVSTYQLLGSLARGRYRVEAWVLNSGGQKQAYMYVKRHGAQEVQVALPVSAGIWKHVEVEVDVTSGNVEIGFYSDAVGGSWINIDDVRVTRR